VFMKSESRLGVAPHRYRQRPLRFRRIEEAAYCYFFDSRHRDDKRRDAARTGFWLSLFRFQGAAAHRTPRGRGVRLSGSPGGGPFRLRLNSHGVSPQAEF